MEGCIIESFTIPGAGGIIEKVDTNVPYILIQERYKKEAPQENGLIEIPSGKIRAFESIYDCLRREVKEETGLDVIEIEGEMDVQTCECNGYKVINYIPFSITQNLHGKYPIMVQVFICKAIGNIKDKSDEAKNFRWIALSELKELLVKEQGIFYPMHIITLKKYLRERL